MNTTADKYKKNREYIQTKLDNIFQPLGLALKKHQPADPVRLSQVMYLEWIYIEVAEREIRLQSFK